MAFTLHLGRRCYFRHNIDRLLFIFAQKWVKETRFAGIVAQLAVLEKDQPSCTV